MDEYGVDCSFEAVNVTTARWVECDDEKELAKFKDRQSNNLALDHAGDLAYIAPTRVNLELAMERHPDVRFHAVREI
jgi:peptide chain release factor 3